MLSEMNWFNILAASWVVISLLVYIVLTITSLYRRKTLFLTSLNSSNMDLKGAAIQIGSPRSGVRRAPNLLIRSDFKKQPELSVIQEEYEEAFEDESQASRTVSL